MIIARPPATLLHFFILGKPLNSHLGRTIACSKGGRRPAICLLSPCHCPPSGDSNPCGSNRTDCFDRSATWRSGKSAGKASHLARCKGIYWGEQGIYWVRRGELPNRSSESPDFLKVLYLRAVRVFPELNIANTEAFWGTSSWILRRSTILRFGKAVVLCPFGLAAWSTCAWSTSCSMTPPPPCSRPGLCAVCWPIY